MRVQRLHIWDMGSLHQVTTDSRDQHPAGRGFSVLGVRNMSTPTIALSVRQPYANAILDGTKPEEYRSKRCLILHRPIYLYATKIPGDLDSFKFYNTPAHTLVYGHLIGIIEFSHCYFHQEYDRYAWVIRSVTRLIEPIKPTGRPQPTWFAPFRIAIAP